MTDLIVAAMRAVTNTMQPPVTYPVYPDWPDFLVIPAKVLLWVLGLFACFLIVMAVSGQSLFWTVLSLLGSLAAWVLVGFSTKGLLYPASLIGLVVLLVWLSRMGQ
jgi:hypothetical protein